MTAVPRLRIGAGRRRQRYGWWRRAIVRIARTAYPAIGRSPMAWVIRFRLVQGIKRRIVNTPAERVLAIVDLLAATETPVWLAGGWGIDALLGRQTRRHGDIDLVIGDDGPPYQQVAQVLAREGFYFIEGSHHPGIPISWCYQWCHDDGHKVEVLPVALHEPPFAATYADTGGVRKPFTEGTISGRPVPCLSAELQLLLHNGYPLREIDVRDLALLRSCLELPGEERLRERE